MPKVSSPRSRFLKYIAVQDSGCWQWIGRVSPHNGNAWFQLETKVSITAQRAAYLLFKGVDPGRERLRRSCSTPMCMNPDHLYVGSLEERFLEKVVKSTNGCWEWTGTKQRAGYGFLWFEGRQHGAHRIAYLLYKGEIPDGMCVCHTCDNPLCCNPDHLWLGSHQDNEQDKYAKGRGLTGDKHPRAVAKLTPEQVLEIRHKAEHDRAPLVSLAKQYGVSTWTIHSAVYGKRWAHLGGPIRPHTGCRKLTDAQVAEMKRRYAEGGVTQKALGEEYGITQTQVSRTVRGLTKDRGQGQCRTPY